MLRLTFTYFKLLNQSMMLLAVFLLIILCSRRCLFKKAWKFRSGSGLDKGWNIRLGLLWLSCDIFMRSNEYKPSLLPTQLMDATVAYPNERDGKVPYSSEQNGHRLSWCTDIRISKHWLSRRLQLQRVRALIKLKCPKFNSVVIIRSLRKPQSQRQRL